MPEGGFGGRPGPGSRGAVRTRSVPAVSRISASSRSFAAYSAGMLLVPNVRAPCRSISSRKYVRLRCVDFREDLVHLPPVVAVDQDAERAAVPRSDVGRAQARGQHVVVARRRHRELDAGGPVTVRTARTMSLVRNATCCTPAPSCQARKSSIWPAWRLRSGWRIVNVTPPD